METALTDGVGLPDADLVLMRRIAAEDEDALRSLYVLYGRRMLFYAHRVVQNESIAEEVVQDALMVAWRGAKGYRGEARLITWLLGIVHRVALNAIRRKQLPSLSLETAEEIRDEGGTPEKAATRADSRHLIRSALARLPQEQRLTVELVFYHELTMAEAAQVLGCPVGTVKSRLSYAKVRLRAVLARAGLRQEDLL